MTSDQIQNLIDEALCGGILPWPQPYDPARIQIIEPASTTPEPEPGTPTPEPRVLAQTASSEGFWMRGRITCEITTFFDYP